MAIKVTNNASGTLASGITDTALSLTLTTGQGAEFPNVTDPSDYFYATIVNAGGTVREIVKVTARTGDNFTIERGADGPGDPIVTTSYAFDAGARMELRFCKAMWDGLAQLGKAQNFTALQTFAEGLSTAKTLYAGGAVNFGSTLGVTGNVSIGGTAQVAGAFTANGAAVFNSTLKKGSANVDAFAANTSTVFRQSSAPTGWTKVTTYNNAAFRVVSGSIGQKTTAGEEFTTLLTDRTIARANLPNVTLSVTGTAADGGNHTHTITIPLGGTFGTGSYVQNTTDSDSNSLTRTTTASGNHSHSVSGTTSSINGGVTQTTMNFSVNYVDLIIATKD